MEKIFIVHAHPEKQSFNATLKNRVIDFYGEANAQVKVSDLYEMGFNPVGDRHDFQALSNPSFFKYQAEQVAAHEKGLFAPDLKEEMDKLVWCNSLIFVFPMWWFGLPAMLKGWVDRVFAMGFCYGAGKGVYDNGIFKDKTAFCLITTGGPEAAYGENGKNGDIMQILYPIHHGMLYFTGMQVKPPFVCFSPARITVEERETELNRLNEYLLGVKKKENLY